MAGMAVLLKEEGDYSQIAIDISEISLDDEETRESEVPFARKMTNLCFTQKL